jgi:hypothetical protein
MGVDHREMPQAWLEIDSIGSIDATDRRAARATPRRIRLVDGAEQILLAKALD